MNDSQMRCGCTDTPHGHVTSKMRLSSKGTNVANAKLIVISDILITIVTFAFVVETVRTGEFLILEPELNSPARCVLTLLQHCLFTSQCEIWTLGPGLCNAFRGAIRIEMI